MASGRNEHAQISSKLESETQTRARLESEVRHVINVMSSINNKEAGRSYGRWEYAVMARLCFVLFSFCLLVFCFYCDLGQDNVLSKFLSPLGWNLLLFSLGFLCIDKTKH